MVIADVCFFCSTFAVAMVFAAFFRRNLALSGHDDFHGKGEWAKQQVAPSAPRIRPYRLLRQDSTYTISSRIFEDLQSNIVEFLIFRSPLSVRLRTYKIPAIFYNA